MTLKHRARFLPPSLASIEDPGSRSAFDDLFKQLRDLWMNTYDDLSDNGIRKFDFNNDLMEIYEELHIGDSSNYIQIKSNGEMNLYGTARISRHLRIGAGSLKVGASSPTAGFTGVYPHLSFSHVVSQEAHYRTIIPRRWDSSTDMEICFDWLYTGAQDNGTVKWGLEYASKKEGEDPATGSITISNASPGSHTTGQLVRTYLTTKILATNLEKLDLLGMRIFRDRANDTLGTGAILLGIHIHLTINKLGQSL